MIDSALLNLKLGKIYRKERKDSRKVRKGKTGNLCRVAVYFPDTVTKIAEKILENFSKNRTFALVIYYFCGRMHDS